MRKLSLIVLVALACGQNRAPAATFTLTPATAVDTAAGTVTLPLHQGLVGRRIVWYIVTESSDREDAARRGVTWAPRLASLTGTAAVQTATVEGGALRYAAGVNFAPERSVVPAAGAGFPPSTATPGSVGEPGYSPFVQLANGVVINAPIIGDERHVLDRVVSFDPARRYVTMRMTRGYADARHAWYISTDASDAMVAALEGATWVAGLASAPAAASVAAGSARFGIVAFANGVTGRNSPDRQGMQSALLDGLSPLNILEGAPGARGASSPYSPLWDLHLVMWTPEAISANQREKLLTFGEVRAFAERGLIVSAMPGTANAAIGGLHAVGVVINCPVVATFALTQGAAAP